MVKEGWKKVADGQGPSTHWVLGHDLKLARTKLQTRIKAEERS